MMQEYQVVRENLLSRRKEITERVGRVENHLRHAEKPLDDDFAEQAIERANDEVLEALDGNMRSEVEQIDHALFLIEQGKYGICVSCGNPIAQKRLLAIPFASVCITCAS